MTNETTFDPLAGVLDILKPRQTAHDKLDREHWLRTRLSGITATEAKVLHTGSTRDKADVVRKKIEGDDFTGNKYTDWGSYREGALLQLAGATEYGWLVHAPGNERHLATPDGLRATWDGFAVVEVKTSKYPIPLGSAKFNDYGYLWQMLWQMYCADTDEAFYVWEQHDDDWARWDQRPLDKPELWHQFGPTPIASGVQHVVLTPELQGELDKMVKAADRALVRLDKKVAELQAAAAEPQSAEDQGVERVAMLALETQAELYREALDAEKVAKERKERNYGGLLESAGKMWGNAASEGVTFEHLFERDGQLYRCGYSPEVEQQVEVTDEAAAREANPELWEQHEAARVAFEAVRDQWQAHATSFTKTEIKTVRARATVTRKEKK